MLGDILKKAETFIKGGHNPDPLAVESVELIFQFFRFFIFSQAPKNCLDLVIVGKLSHLRHDGIHQGKIQVGEGLLGNLVIPFLA